MRGVFVLCNDAGGMKYDESLYVSILLSCLLCVVAGLHGEFVLP